MHSPAHPLLLPAALRSHREPPRPSLVTADGRYDGRAIMALAHAEARANVARAAARGVARRYSAALKAGLSSAWETARAQRFCHCRDAAMAALPAAHAAIVHERTAALMIDSTSRMVAELAAIDARALAMGVRV